MQRLTALCHETRLFPRNLGEHGSLSNVGDLYERLSRHAAGLFSGEDESSLAVLELNRSGKEFQSTCIRSEKLLRNHLGLTDASGHSDPRCRYVFVQAIKGSTRRELQTTRGMLMLCFTYLAVMPEFVDFLFSFGYQRHVQDPYFSSFRQRTRLSKRSEALEIAELGWSGHEIQMCYNLRSAERYGASPEDWFIEPWAVHHTFDVKTIRANWITIKANHSLKDRVEAISGGRDHRDTSSFETLDGALAASLAMHSVFCSWAAEGWRWYTNDLGDRFRDISGRTLSRPVVLPLGLAAARHEPETMPTPAKHKLPNRLYVDAQKIISSAAATFHPRTPWAKRSSNANSNPASSDKHRYTDPETGLSQPLPPHIKKTYAPGPDPQKPQTILESIEDKDFSFATVQKVQYIEEKTHEALLVLRLNIGIISQLKQYYATIVKSRSFPQDLAHSCQEDLEQFDLQLDGVINHLQTQILRLETLLCLLGDHKSLLHSILEYLNMESNKLSTENIVAMTEDMNDLARKTKIETVSMKAITVVTLFFLPGTFISRSIAITQPSTTKPQPQTSTSTTKAATASFVLIIEIRRLTPRPPLQTLMSTEIFQSSNADNPGPNPFAHLSPLQLYLAASLPLTFVTMTIWLALHWLEKHKEKVKLQAKKLESTL